MTTFRGMTWSHPRGRDPMLALAAAAARPGALAVPGSSVAWDAQSLAGFESHPIGELARRYDLIVLDHPGLGAAAEALAPLEELLSAETLERLGETAVGGAMASYHHAGRQLALPIDAAAQVRAVAAGRQDDVEADDWARALRCAERLPAAVPTLAPHTLLTWLGIVAAHEPAFAPGPQGLAPRAAGRAALEVLRRLLELTRPAWHGLDPIGLLDRMAAETDLSWSPLLFGYVTYADPGQARPVHFADAPAATDGGPPGSVLGGTGLAVARRARGAAGLVDHVLQAVHPIAQRQVIPAAGGQPAARAAWDDERLDESSMRFYSATRRTQECAWRRPRHAGWIAFQNDASIALYDGLKRHADAEVLLDQLDTLYRRARPVEAID